MFSCLLTRRRISAYTCITLYGLSRRQEEGQAALLLRRRKCPRRWQAPHRPPGLSRHCRQGRRPRQGPHVPSPSIRRLARLRLARCSVARRRANRPVWRVGGALARIPIRPFARPLSIAGRHPPHLSTRAQDRRWPIGTANHPAFALGNSAGTLHLASLLGRF